MKEKHLKTGVLALALVLLIGAFSAVAAAGVQPRYDQTSYAEGNIRYGEQKFTVMITGGASVTQITGIAVLYEEGFWGDTKIATLAINSNGATYYGEQPCTIRQRKSYRLEISASVCRKGVWEPITKTVTASF